MIPKVLTNLPLTSDISNFPFTSTVERVNIYNLQLQLKVTLLTISVFGFNDKNMSRINEEQVNNIPAYSVLSMVRLNDQLYLCGEYLIHANVFKYSIYYESENTFYCLFGSDIYGCCKKLFKKYNVMQYEINHLFHKFNETICKPIKLLYLLK